MFAQIRPAMTMLTLLTALCCVVYPLAVTGIGKGLFPAQAEGSLVVKDGVLRGSTLIGQAFSSPKYFWSRPSATSPMPNNGAGSSGSNLGPTNPVYLEAVKGRVEALRAADPSNKTPIPVDLVTASGSGLDPEISVAAALYQVRRVAQVRGLAPERVKALVDQHTLMPAMGFLGEPRVNVLALNLALDAMKD